MLQVSDLESIIELFGYGLLVGIGGGFAMWCLTFLVNMVFDIANG